MFAVQKTRREDGTKTIRKGNSASKIEKWIAYLVKDIRTSGLPGYNSLEFGCSMLFGSWHETHFRQYPFSTKTKVISQLLPPTKDFYN
ncbi:CLUMA_CG011328, isoform A [Clunio marinus]|uniref:CLUMA_CG011328, isoform A n=1 Tax=Clunio marinus TaxID=568069 RepID=A0A1J1IEH5_9DIPT|nr:CLUMA_CG011328, isoform A [Clunio marinus]